MGLNIAEIVPRKEISLDDLNGKIIAVDAFNTIYQFLSTIRQPDGTPLMDSKKRVTSHLSGLFYRNINLMQTGIRLVYCFDGLAPEEKAKTQEKRLHIKREAEEKYNLAKEKKDVEEMGKYARQFTHLTSEMIEESKKLLDALGIPYIQAPGEGEAQASYLARHNEDIYAVASQDYDSLVFNAPRLIQNLTLARKRKTSAGYYIPVNPELIELEKVLSSLQLTHEQLICLGILVGTDYNPGGVKGIGQKRALAIVQKYKQPVLIFKAEELKDRVDFNWQDIFELFKKPEVIKNFNLKFKAPDKEKLKKILCDEHEFSEERVLNALQRLEENKEKKKQSDLKKWF